VLEIDRARAAIVSLDMQAGVVSVYVKDAGLIARAADVMRAARQAGVRVVHVKVAFVPACPKQTLATRSSAP
jgi:nicotinamidase-related amidase